MSAEYLSSEEKTELEVDYKIINDKLEVSSHMFVYNTNKTKTGDHEDLTVYVNGNQRGYLESTSDKVYVELNQDYTTEVIVENICIIVCSQTPVSSIEVKPNKLVSNRSGIRSVGEVEELGVVGETVEGVSWNVSYNVRILEKMNNSVLIEYTNSSETLISAEVNRSDGIREIKNIEPKVIKYE